MDVVVYSFDGRLIVMVSGDHIVWLWNARIGLLMGDLFVVGLFVVVLVVLGVDVMSMYFFLLIGYVVWSGLLMVLLFVVGIVVLVRLVCLSVIFG